MSGFSLEQNDEGGDKFIFGFEEQSDEGGTPLLTRGGQTEEGFDEGGGTLSFLK